MYTTTTKGYRLPSDGDRGTWWANLIFNFQRTNDHTHDGTNSQLISTTALDKQVVSLAAAGWVATTGGTYRQLVTNPAGATFPKLAMHFFINGGAEDGFEIFPSIEMVSSTTFYVYINDNTLNLKVIYA